MCSRVWQLARSSQHTPFTGDQYRAGRRLFRFLLAPQVPTLMFGKTQFIARAALHSVRALSCCFVEPNMEGKSNEDLDAYFHDVESCGVGGSR